MDLYQLRYFLEAARTLNFARAAENSHISPPAISRSIALLERSVGQNLFHRAKRRVTLTPAGERLQAHAQRAFDELDRARLALEAERDQSPALLRVGSREMITNYLLPGPLREFRRRFPATRFGLFELEPRQFSEALKSDRLDFGFYYADIADPALESRRLGRLRSHVYAAKGEFRGASRGLENLLRQPFIAPRYFEADPSMPGADGFPDRRHERNIQYEAEFLETHRRFVLDGVAVGVLPDLVMRDDLARGCVRRLRGPAIFREIYFLKRRNRPLPTAVDWLLSNVQKAIRRHGYL